MGDFVKVASTSDIPAGEGLAVEVEDKAIAIFNVDGNFHAMDNTCKHQGGPLGEGTLDETTVTCPWHGWEYDVSTGACLTNPAVSQIQYTVKVEGDDILVEI